MDPGYDASHRDLGAEPASPRFVCISAGELCVPEDQTGLHCDSSLLFDLLRSDFRPVQYLPGDPSPCNSSTDLQLWRYGSWCSNVQEG